MPSGGGAHYHLCWRRSRHAVPTDGDLSESTAGSVDLQDHLARAESRRERTKLDCQWSFALTWNLQRQRRDQLEARPTEGYVNYRQCDPGGIGECNRLGCRCAYACGPEVYTRRISQHLRGHLLNAWLSLTYDFIQSFRGNGFDGLDLPSVHRACGGRDRTHGQDVSCDAYLRSGGKTTRPRRSHGWTSATPPANGSLARQSWSVKGEA